MYTIAVVTGTRAEYGLLRPVLRRLWGDADFHTQLLVTGAHLHSDYGMTVQEIEADGYEIAARLDILSQPVPQGRAATAQRTALALQLFTNWLGEHRPDVLLALGDRYEMLAAGQAAALLGIPVAHISGGDVTQGADDDWFRHCLTKMAKLHFPSCEAYRRRIIRMGENPGTVFNVGGLGDENIRSLPLLTASEAAQQLGLEIPETYALVTLHPETASHVGPDALAAELLGALASFPQLFCLFTGANADAGGGAINDAVAYHCRNHSNAAQVTSLGVLRYLSLAKNAAVVVGNSSSGVVETPSLGVPALDIGDRQKGRISAENVLHCEANASAIVAALNTALSPEFRMKARNVNSPYNGGSTSRNIVYILKQFLCERKFDAPKTFYDGEDGGCNS